MQRLPRYLSSRPVLLRRTINTAIGAGGAGAVIALAGFGESSLAASEYKVMQHWWMCRRTSPSSTQRGSSTRQCCEFKCAFTSNLMLTRALIVERQKTSCEGRSLEQ